MNHTPIDYTLNTSQTSASSETTGLGSSYIVTNDGQDFEMKEDWGKETGVSGVDQGAEHDEPPRALYAPGGGLPPTGYEPKPSSMNGDMVDGVQYSRLPTGYEAAGGEEEPDLDIFGCRSGPAEGQATPRPKSSRNFGSELYELEEKLQAMQILMEGRVQEVDQRVQHLSEEVNKVHKHGMTYASDWGSTSQTS